MKYTLLLIFVLGFCKNYAQKSTTIQLDIASTKTPISPYLYGKNFGATSTAQSLIVHQDAGITFFRENGGNNSTKYNWRKKLSSHPDWYNNVYTNDWDTIAQQVQAKFPQAQAMFAFQLLGKVAQTNAYNFKDNLYNKSQVWEGVHQNLAGGGTLNPTGKTALSEGNPDLYLQTWTADSTTEILNHWFDTKGLGLNPKQFLYWNMDNEPDIWSGTHDDVMKTQISPEQFIVSYVEVAQKARKKFPAIKLAAPSPANEWQWYAWTTTSKGKTYSWLEYFIKRIAEEEKKSGLKLLDVLDIHFYPASQKLEEVLQMHRVYFDTTYIYPEANGLSKVNGKWDTSLKNEYIFERCKRWLVQYMGENHGVKFGVSETGVEINNPSAVAVWYASTLGEFMKHSEMEFFSPWSWKVGMFETVHLLARYNKNLALNAVSDNEQFVSAYPSINTAGDSLTVVLVNRSIAAFQVTTVNIKGFQLDPNTNYTMFSLSNLPTTETFVSHRQNALQTSSIKAVKNTLHLNLAPLSIVSIILKKEN